MDKLKYPGSLHNHTHASNLRLRDCIIRENELIDYAIELGHEVVAFTEHDSVSNVIKIEKYYKKIKEKNPNFKVILGNEIYLCRNGLSKETFVKGQDRFYHFILLAKDSIGHQQIREISTRAWLRSWMNGKMRRVPTYYQDLVEIIGKNPGHVIGSTACLGGALPTQLLKQSVTNDLNLMEKIKIWIMQMDNIFGHGNFFFELQPSHNNEQIYVNRKLIELSVEFDIPYIITTDSHYLKTEDRNIHKAYLNAQNGDREVDDFYATTYMMNTEELESYMKLTEEELQFAYQNILNIKNMCEDYSLMKPLKIPELKWKEHKAYAVDNFYSDIPWLSKFIYSDFSGDRELALAIIEKISTDKSLQNKEAYAEINQNLEATWVSSEVNKTHWSSYFLNLEKIIDVCWEAGTLIGPGRGSGVGFILLYILGITQINPLREKTRTFSWRFLNPERVSVLDVDVDIEGGRRGIVLNKLRQVYGFNRVANVATFGTEKARSAILTAARGLGIDVDIAQYLASMVEADRGIQRSLKQTMYGDAENGISQNKQFYYEMTENYPELWEVAQKIEGLTCRMGIHAGGVIFVDEPFENSTALMRAPDGTIITQFDLHDCEDVSLIKYDLLSVEALDKIHNCLDLLCDYGYIERKETLKETYEAAIGIYNLERDSKKMWEMAWNHEVMSLFQMEKQSGIQGISLTHPQSVDDLATLNSVIRLMAQEKGAEQPLNKYARFKKDISLWYDEMDSYGLTKAEQKLLEPIIQISYGICESQERFMQLVQLPECGGFNLTWADSLRKSIAKKNPAAYEKLQEEYFKTVEEKGLSKNLCNYVWNVLVATSRGYGFNLSHTLAYSLIALQELNLAYRYPIIFWNCSCLIADSGGAESEDENDEEFDVYTDNYDELYTEDIEDFLEQSEEEDDVEDDDSSVEESKKKKKTRNSNYGKIATAIGKMRSMGIKIVPPNINKSTYTFSPDADSNVIRYGLSGITKIGEELIQTILKNRPYTSLENFLDKVKINKPQMINLIKCGAFDDFGETREEVLRRYITLISEPKKRLTLQNMRMLIDFNMLPESLDLEKKIFNFNKYLKKNKDGIYYNFDNIAFDFYSKYFDIDILDTRETDSGFAIKQAVWDKIYKKKMDPVRTYLSAHQIELLSKVNNKLVADLWDKYCEGNISKWEMDSISYYYHEHELANVDYEEYGFTDFFKLPDNPQPINYFRPKNSDREIPIFNIERIIGTVLDRDKSKKIVTLLTPTGVVTVKIFGQVFANYDKQISERGVDGKKHVIEKSVFSRGNKIIVTGIRREDAFIGKKYSRTPYHLVEQIVDVDKYGFITIQSERAGEVE